ncbi:MAG: glycerol-3-phosphate dehydrogenase/oxidase [Verrucomicrobia bacterium]|nr:glycerol-3-phosphate dehydrogenase/oxidase [Verrucomicrobiota bacterium]
MQRDSFLSRLRAGSETFDLLIVGGGASGLGAALDAAARGHRVALIEQGDFAKGTSSRSTKLVHGGVRYLGQGNISLVKSALHERGLLLRNAPHLAHPMPFVIPNYSWWGGPYYAFGLTLYDAVLANYCECVGLVKVNGLVAGVQARDLETGAEFAIRAKAVINATGVFVDALRKFDEPAGKPMVTVSQGVHLVLPREFLPGSSALMIPKTADGRVLFAIPWHDKLVVGTTDTPNVPASTEPRALPEEVGFIMDHAQQYLARDPSESDVLSVFAGLRPLVRKDGAGSTAALSRDHTIAISTSRLITLTGGKWTTYRKMAEDVIDQAERVAGLAHKPSPTGSLAIHGAADIAGIERTLQFYGSDAAGIAASMKADPALAAAVHPALAIRQGEVLWHVRNEMARTVEDVLARRTRSLVLDAKAAIEAAPLVARLLAKELRRDDAWVAAQVRDFTALARGWLLKAPAATTPKRNAPLVA